MDRDGHPRYILAAEPVVIELIDLTLPVGFATTRTLLRS